MTKTNDRLKAIRENAAALRRSRSAGDAPDSTTSGEVETDLSVHFGIAALDQATAGRAVQRLPVGLIAPDLRPEARQPRLLPLPEELMVDGAPAPEYVSLVADLLSLGHSLKERQIQPIIVYPGTSGQYPAARYLILVGHRRWTAACLISLSELDAIVIDPPAMSERVQLQYAENEDRADFTDMERAWALAQMKRALNDAPWETVAERFRMSESRRHELTRLLAFTSAQQVRIARLRLRENQLVPLHQAVRAGELPEEQVDRILSQIEERRAHSQSSARVDGMTIARLVARAKRAAGVSPGQSPQWLSSLRSKVGSVAKDVKRLQRRFDELSDDDRAALRQDIKSLAATLNKAVADLDRPRD